MKRITLILLIILTAISYISISLFPTNLSMQSSTDNVENKLEALEKNLPDILAKNPILYIEYSILAILIILSILTGLIILGWAVNKKIHKKDIYRFSVPEFKIPWGVKELIEVVVLFLFLNISFSWLSSSVIKYLGLEGTTKRFIIFGNLLLVEFLIFLAVFYYIFIKPRTNLNIVRKWKENLWYNLKFTIGSYLGAVPLIIVMFSISVIVANYFNYKSEPHPLITVILKTDSLIELFLILLFAGLLGPIIEEVFFRLFLLGIFKNYFSVFISIFLTAVIFALLHLSIVGFLPIFTLGLLLAFVYQKTKNILYPIVIHALHNGILLCVALMLKAGIRAAS